MHYHEAVPVGALTFSVQSLVVCKLRQSVKLLYSPWLVINPTSAAGKPGKPVNLVPQGLAIYCSRFCYYFALCIC